MVLKNFITQNTCKSTVGGWIWYCDACDTHGNANDSTEADFMAEQHAKYFGWLEGAEVGEDEEIPEYMSYDPALRDDPELDWSYDCLHATHLINARTGITYNYGEDYTDTTPNKVGDLDIALEIQKRMGIE